MLMILSVADGKYTEAEGKEVANYLTKQGKSVPDLDKELKNLNNVPKGSLPWYFKRAASAYFAYSTEVQRLDFLIYAFRLIKANDDTSIEEYKIIQSLAKFWKIDISYLLEENKLMQSNGL